MQVEKYQRSYRLFYHSVSFLHMELFTSSKYQFYILWFDPTGVIWYFEPHGKLNPGSIYLWYFDPGVIWYFEPHGKLNPGSIYLWYFDPGFNFPYGILTRDWNPCFTALEASTPIIRHKMTNSNNIFALLPKRHITRGYQEPVFIW
jgi:hypothetical protein